MQVPLSFLHNFIVHRPAHLHGCRAGQKTEYLINSNPEAFEKTINDAIAHIKNKQPEHQIIFLKAWNEWGEGNYVEPDKQFGHGWLNAIKNALNK